MLLNQDLYMDVKKQNNIIRLVIFTQLGIRPIDYLLSIRL